MSKFIEVNNPSEGKILINISNIQYIEDCAGYAKIYFRAGCPLYSDILFEDIKKILHLNNPRAREVRCIETGEVYSTVKEAAESAECNYSNMRAHLSGDIRTCRGKHYQYLEKFNDAE